MSRHVSSAMSATLLFATLPVFVIASLAMPAGIGGGLLYVPLLVPLGISVDHRQASALAQPLIFGASLAAIAYNTAWQYRHPEKRLMRPEIVLAAMPPCLAGAMIGALLNRTLPAMCIRILLLMVLFGTLQNILNKALVMWRKEVGEKKVALESKPSVETVGQVQSVNHVEEGVAPSEPVAEDGVDITEDTPHSAFTVFTEMPERTPSTLSVASRRSGIPQAPKTGRVDTGSEQNSGDQQREQQGSCCDEAAPSFLFYWSALPVVWGILAVCLVLRGGSTGSVVGVQLCSVEYWLVTAIGGSFLLASSLFLKHPDVQQSVCLLVGIVSAIVGIGGGLFMNPMLLKAGVEPSVSTATVTIMVMMVSSNAAINFLLAGSIPLVPSLVLSCATFLGSLCGKSIVGWIVQRTGHSSILVFLLGGFVTVSAVVVLLQTVMEGLRHDSSDWQFQDPCILSQR